MSKQKDQFIALLGDLFQLNQPELDFGLYRILHARSAQIKAFIDTELGSEIDAHFAGQSQSNAHDALEAARVKVSETLGEDAFLPTGELKPEYRGTKVGKEYELAQQHARDGGGVLADDAQVYEHLYRFFSRYYDKGDFMSKRYFVAENDSRAAPYAVPYDGREVMLHWANKDQYYIKSSEALSNFTFDLTAALAKEQGPQSGFEFQPAATTPLKVHFRLAGAAEGEHNNVKEGQERFFIIRAAEPLKLETNDKGLPELIVQFDYRPDSTKSGQAGTWQQKRLAEAEQVVGEQLANLVFKHPELRAFEEPLFAPAPTDKQPTRTLLAKYLGQFTARNTMDYFIHKNLGGFLRRELDFYIKNEIIRLDDIEAADAPRVDEYLKKLRVLRKIARRIVDFLAQLEDFQKKLWNKKKFVVETQYCTTLDRIPENFYAEIAANEQQREEWASLFSIDEAAENRDCIYSIPLTVDFLKKNKSLMIDTRHFSQKFKDELVSKLENTDEQCDSLIVHSENYQALSLLRNKLAQKISCIYIDPPYNTGNDDFIYKDRYQESSWASMISDRIELSIGLLSQNAPFLVSLDDKESPILREILRSQPVERLGEFVWRTRNTDNRVISNFSLDHESIHVFTLPGGKLSGRTIDRSSFKNADNDPRGPYTTDPLTGKANAENRPNLHYTVTNPETGDIYPPEPDFGWITDKAGFEQLLKNKLVHWPSNPTTGKPRKKRFLKDTPAKGPISSYALAIKQGEGNQGLSDIIGYKALNFPKPVSIMESIIDASTEENGLIADYFAGSGTTGHAVLNMNRRTKSKRSYLLIEGGAHFDSVLIPRIKKSTYSDNWKNGKPISCSGVSHSFKYIRLESFEDTLNNLQLPDTPRLNVGSPESNEMSRDYLLKYWLEFETAGSPSLLNVREFADPTSYTLRVKQPGSDAQVEKTIDLVETFNWLIGLHVAHLDQPRHYAIELVRETDPELPKDQDTRWRSTAIKERDDGEFWFRAVEGHILSVPGDDLSRERVLVIWRKLTGDSGRNQAALEAWLNKRDINPRESEFAYIYVNGNHALPSDGNAATRVRLIEETFAQRMWEDA